MTAGRRGLDCPIAWDWTRLGDVVDDGASIPSIIGGRHPLCKRLEALWAVAMRSCILGPAAGCRPVGSRKLRTVLVMLYAILAYHLEATVASWTPAEDAALMADLNKVHVKLAEEGRLGPAARLGATEQACTLRGPGAGVVMDGPFAETKEQLLGFYVVDCADRDGAVAAARDLRRANPTAVYEIRPVRLYLPGVPLADTEPGPQNARD